MNPYPPMPARPNNTGWIIAIVLICIIGLPGAGFFGMILGAGIGSTSAKEEYLPRIEALQAQITEYEDKQPKLLEESERAKITGRASLKTNYSSQSFSGSLYNGSSTPLSAVVIQLTTKDSDGKEIAKREYRVEINLAPQSTGTFSFDIYDEGKTVVDTSWSINEAYSRPASE